MTPKKIYIAESSSKELCKKRYVWDCNASEELIDEGAWKINIPYILESEHNKQIEELKAENERQKNTIDFNVKENINILKKLSESIAENEKLKMERDYCSMVANDLLEDSKWISVEEKMPEYNVPILAYTHKGALFQCSIDSEIEFDFLELYLAKDNVTHWRKLPNPPQV